MGTPTNLPLTIPGSGPPVAVPDTAGGNSEPMDADTIYQPVIEYCTFIQNNLAQTTSGNTLQVMREAEQSYPIKNDSGRTGSPNRSKSMSKGCRM